ncbi:MAG TPA: chloride channel protein, partial [Chitinophagaceae bacterium]
MESLIKRKPVGITNEDTVRTAVEIMAKENAECSAGDLPDENKIIGILSYKDMLGVYRLQRDEHQQILAISVKRQTLKLLAHGKKTLSFIKEK